MASYGGWILLSHEKSGSSWTGRAIVNGVEMKVAEIRLINFRRFRDLVISGIPCDARLILLVGPNGSGKSSVLDGFLYWYRQNVFHVGFESGSDSVDYKYCFKAGAIPPSMPFPSAIIRFHDSTSNDKSCMYFRTAFRNDADFQVEQFGRIEAPSENLRFQRFIDNDQVVSANYERLIYNTISEFIWMAMMKRRYENYERN
jgi:hypothetical protein